MRRFQAICSLVEGIGDIRYRAASGHNCVHVANGDVQPDDRQSQEEEKLVLIACGKPRILTRLATASPSEAPSHFVK